MIIEARVRALHLAAIAATMILAGCSLGSRLSGIQQSQVTPSVDRENFSHMTTSEAVSYLRDAARTYNPYPNDEYARDDTSDRSPLAHPRMCVFSERGIFDRNENRVVPFSEWIFAASEGQKSAYDKIDMALVVLNSRKFTYHVDGATPETICDTYRRDMRNAPSAEISQEIQNVATALEFLGVSQK